MRLSFGIRAGLVCTTLCCATGVCVAAAPAPRPAAAVPAAALPPVPATRPAAVPTTRPATAPAIRPATAPAVRPATRPVAVKPNGPEPLPTMAELKEMLDQARYPELLHELPRVLILRGKAAEPYNKYDLWMLRFETHMRLKQQAAAMTDLREAQETTDDAKRINYCKGVTLLIKQSRNFQYQPSPMKKEKPPTIDIIDPEKRKEALKALLADELAVVGPKVEKALDGKSLEAVAQAVNSLQGFDVLESAADAPEESSRMIADLRARGNTILAKTVIRLTARADEITRSANELITYQVAVPQLGGGIGYETRMRKRGLTNDDYRDLYEIIKTSDKLAPNIKGLAQATGGKMKDVEDLISANEELHRKADRTLKANYNEY